MKNKSYVITEANGAFLCGDNKFRDFTGFGTYRSCVKDYVTVGHALNAARKFRFRMRSYDDLVVMTVDWKSLSETNYDDFYMNTAHIIWKGVKKTYPQLIADVKNGVANGFPVTFTFLQ